VDETELGVENEIFDNSLVDVGGDNYVKYGEGSVFSKGGPESDAPSIAEMEFVESGVGAEGFGFRQPSNLLRDMKYDETDDADEAGRKLTMTFLGVKHRGKTQESLMPSNKGGTDRNSLMNCLSA
jgi:hypothetical protein